MFIYLVVKMELTLINTNLNKYTFKSKKIKNWVEQNCGNNVLNLFAGDTLLDVNEIRNDVDTDRVAMYHKDVYDFICEWDDNKFDTIILDPPYSYRKSMKFYNGKYSSKFKLIADKIPEILTENGIVISFGYHSTFMGKTRNFELKELCVFAHGGAQHCTIGLIEQNKNLSD